MTNWERLLELGAWSANGHTFFGHTKVGEWVGGEFVVNDAGAALIKAGDQAEFGAEGDPDPAPADAPDAPAAEPAAPASTKKPRVRKPLAQNEVADLEKMLDSLQ